MRVTLPLTTGRASIFEIALTKARRLYLTEVDADVEGDVVVVAVDGPPPHMLPSSAVTAIRRRGARGARVIGTL